MHCSELPTPALTIRLDILENNLDRMANHCRQLNLGLRPHTKTHKIPEVARMQLQRGAAGLTVAKVGEAEIMAEVGPDEILIAYPICGRENLERLAKLARGRRIVVSLDCENAAEALSTAALRCEVVLGTLVEVDVGYHRCGVEPGGACVELARKIERIAGLEFRGVMAFFGNIWGTEAERKDQARQVAESMERTLAAFKQDHFPLEIVSGGSTPSAGLASVIPGLTEIRPGTYALNDLNTVFQDVSRLEECAARVVTTVVSTTVQGRAIIDAGSKTLSSDGLISGPGTGYGHIVEASDAVLFALDEEHGFVDISHSARRFRVGEMLTVIPNHACTCVNMHDEAFLLRNDEVVGKWKVAARGKIR
jgi:D-serine deaminase-like pyridoxal phosphate-dependent protein